MPIKHTFEFIRPSSTQHGAQSTHSKSTHSTSTQSIIEFQVDVLNRIEYATPLISQKNKNKNSETSRLESNTFSSTQSPKKNRENIRNNQHVRRAYYFWIQFFFFSFCFLAHVHIHGSGSNSWWCGIRAPFRSSRNTIHDRTMSKCVVLCAAWQY